MRKLLPLVLVPLLLATACADPNATPRSEQDVTRLPGDVVLRVEVEGGFVAPHMQIDRLPSFSLYGDGRVIVPGAQIAIYPGPALPSLTVRKIAPSAVDQLVLLAVDAGVGSGADLGTPAVADLPSTVFTVTVSGGVRRTSVYALGFDNGLSEGQRAARQKLSDLIDRLTDLPGTLGEADAGEEQPYEPAAMAVIARPWSEPAETPEQEARPWPGPELPGPTLPSPAPPETHCLTVTGADLTAVLAAAAWPANVLTPWVSGGERFFVTFRPLLPDESTCADLTR